MKSLFNIQLDDNKFDYLMCEQAKGKTLKIENGDIVAVETVPTQTELYKNELNHLKQWFDVEYMRAEQKYRRLHTLQLLCDNGTTPYDMLIWLYKEAEVKRKRIQELEGLINE